MHYIHDMCLSKYKNEDKLSIVFKNKKKKKKSKILLK